MEVRDAIKLVESDGWRLERTRGSHHQYHHPTKPGIGNHRWSPVAGFGPEVKGVYTKTGRPEMNQYTVFFAQTPTGYNAHVPDLPGCVAAGATLEETRQLIREAIEFHIEGMRLHGEAVPPPTSLVEQVEVPV